MPKDVCADMVVGALKAGWRHLDCACDYGNEEQVGAGIKAAIEVRPPRHPPLATRKRVRARDRAADARPNRERGRGGRTPSHRLRSRWASRLLALRVPPLLALPFTALLYTTRAAGRYLQA